jgi:hypothetical protein
MNWINWLFDSMKRTGFSKTGSVLWKMLPEKLSLRGAKRWRWLKLYQWIL